MKGEITAAVKHTSLPNNLSNLQDVLQDSSAFSRWMDRWMDLNEHHFSGRAIVEWESTGI